MTTASRPSIKPLMAISRQGVLIALVLLMVFGGFRYEGFISEYNIESVLRYNSMFGLIALGMTFVIITGGIDLSVGSVIALCSVVAAKLSPEGAFLGLLVPVLVGALIGCINGAVITRLQIAPFIVTLATLLGARGLALLISNNQSISVEVAGSFIQIGQGDFLGFPIPACIMLLAFVMGGLALTQSRFGRYALSVGDNEEAARLMGLPVDSTKFWVYVLSGSLSGLAGVILASQFGAGQPTEGVGWELSAIAAVVVGGTLLTGGVGTVWGTLVGVLLLGMIFNVLNFENGKGFINLSVYWQSVIRGLFLLLVVILQSRLSRKRV
ncbi:ABC transporter permease [Deinococcus cellulosilyticus]|uniref:Sugar ABC transporter permease n=1 Tax=Deinococcus cellulosilyticus (strain DSM 18568 / NBRC 106333 / KACC 11606 / 5516J-15) TaxID=1223518 RepID=A0A511MVD6_DEIC1|nr:ABC transporter permease [Deinococcus cellulosilyticus]GEM44542.1 sugar ABC transporter permease [Deinococcus cellulosilyticus NBRC 106333 = KACC 11606]